MGKDRHVHKYNYILKKYMLSCYLDDMELCLLPPSLLFFPEIYRI